MLDSAGVRAAGDALVWGAGGPGGRAGCVDRGVAGRVGGVAAAAGPGLLELLAAAELRRAGREGQSEGGQALGWPAGRAVTAATAIRGGWCGGRPGSA